MPLTTHTAITLHYIGIDNSTTPINTDTPSIVIGAEQA